MIKHITVLFILFLLGESFLFSSDREYDKFDYIRKDDSGRSILIAKSGDKYGVLDLFGKEIIKTDYSQIRYLQENFFLVQKDTLYGYFDLSGQVILPVEYSNSKVLNYSQTRDYLKAHDFYIIYKNGRYGVFDRKRRQVIVPTEYDWVVGKDFSGDVINISKQKSSSETIPYISALLHKDNQKSLIDLKTGETIIDFGIYDRIEPSDKYGFIIVSKDGKNAVVDYQNNIVIPFQEDALSILEFGFLNYQENNKGVQFISKDRLSKSALYDSINMYSNGLSKVVLDSKSGVINAIGKEIVAPKYDYIYITDHYIEAGISGESSTRNYFFDVDGKPLFPPLNYEDVEYYAKSGLVVVGKNDNEGLVNRKGKLIMPLKYRRIYLNEDDQIIRFEVNTKSGVKMGLANIQGKVIVNPRYDKIDDFVDGVAEIGLKTDDNYLHGLINLKGEEILKPQFSSIFFNLDSAKHYTKVYDNTKVGIISRNGRITVVPEYDDIIYQDRYTDDWGDLAITKLNNLYGIVNMSTGNVIEEAVYNYIYTIGRGDSLLFCLRSADGNSIINKDGNTMLASTEKIIYPIFGSKNDYCLIQQDVDGEKGLISALNQQFIPCVYEDVYQLADTLFRVKLDGKIGVVDKYNNVILPIEFDIIQPYSSSNNIMFAKKGEDYGYIFLDEKDFKVSSLGRDLYEAYMNQNIGL